MENRFNFSQKWDIFSCRVQSSVFNRRVALAFLLFCGVFGLSADIPTSQVGVDETQAGDDVTLKKKAEWVTHKGNGAAEVTLTFEGLEKVAITAEPIDVLFVLDVSMSMTDDDGCLNPNHGHYPMYFLHNTNTDSRHSRIFNLNGQAWTTFFSNYINSLISNGTLTVDGGAYLDPQFRVEIPSSMRLTPSTNGTTTNYNRTASRMFLVPYKKVLCTQANLWNS